MRTETTAQAISFDDVKVGDVLRYRKITRGFMPDDRIIEARVVKVTANTVSLERGHRLTRGQNFRDILVVR